MGRVFSFEQLRDREAPSQADFETARRLFAERVTEAKNRGLVRGAMIFGSAAIRKTSARSDLDCFIVLSDDKQQNWDAASDVILDLRAATGNRIPIGAIGRSAAQLQKTQHEMDRFFGAHLVGPHRVVTGEDPAQFLQFDDRPGIEILHSFMVSKVRKISEYAWLDNEQRDEQRILDIYQRVLELPNAVGRKALRALDEVEDTSRGVENSADKSLVGNASLTLFAELGVGSHAARLLETDAEYTTLVADALKNGIGERKYGKVLNELDEVVIPSIGWLMEAYEALEARIGR